MYRDKRIGVVVLAYNVEDHIAAVLQDMPDYVDAVYVVDDGSADGTADIVRDFVRDDCKLAGLPVSESDQLRTQNAQHRTPRVALLQHAVNRGPGAALSTGYRRAMDDQMDIIVKVDGDNQMRLDEMVLLIDPIADGRADYSKGNRLASAEHRRDMPRFRLVGNFMLTWLTRVASGNWHVNDPQNGYTAVANHALSAVGWDLYPYYGYLNQILVRLRVHRFKILNVSMIARYGRETSSIRLWAYIPKVSLLLLRLYVWRLHESSVFTGRSRASVVTRNNVTGAVTEGPP